MSESRRKRLSSLQAPTSLLERISRAIQPSDRPAPITHSAFWHAWRKAQATASSRISRYYPTPTRAGDRTGITFQDGTTLIRRADGSLRYPFPRVRRTGRIRRAEKALRRLNTHRVGVGC